MQILFMLPFVCCCVLLKIRERHRLKVDILFIILLHQQYFVYIWKIQLMVYDNYSYQATQTIRTYNHHSSISNHNYSTRMWTTVATLLNIIAAHNNVRVVTQILNHGWSSKTTNASFDNTNPKMLQQFGWWCRSNKISN